MTGMGTSLNVSVAAALLLFEAQRQRAAAGFYDAPRLDAETHARLVDRRAGIEPLIGHAKQGGQLGQSRMKTDDTTLAAGYAAIGGLNLRQLIRHLLGKDIKPMG